MSRLSSLAHRTQRLTGPLAASLVALCLSSLATHAADLYRDDPLPRSGAAYEDPRYADLYGNAPAPRPRVETYRPYEPRAYEPRTYEPHPYEPRGPIPRERVYRDNRDDAYEPPRYARAEPPRDSRSARGCPSKDEISRMLGSDGWGQFQNPQVIDRTIATIDATRPNGKPYRLEVDRCTGEILAIKPLDGPRYGSAAPSYAPYAGEPRRYRQY
jgi:hypothetical protein